MSSLIIFRQQKGIALLQVLFLSVIFSVFMISVMAKVRSQIQTAEMLTQHADAAVMLNTLESRAIFELLTTRWSDSAFAKSPAPTVTLYSHQMTMPEGVVRLASVSSLASVYNFDLIKHLLILQNYPDDKLELALQSWKRAVLSGNDISIPSGDNIAAENIVDRGIGIQYEEELNFLPDFERRYLSPILPVLTNYPAKSVYPLGMPDRLLSFYLGEPELTEALKLRRSGILTADYFRQFIQTSEFFTVSEQPGPGFVLNFTAEVNGVKLQRQATYVVTPYDGAPVRVWEYKKFN